MNRIEESLDRQHLAKFWQIIDIICGNPEQSVNKGHRRKKGVTSTFNAGDYKPFNSLNNMLIKLLTQMYYSLLY
jgi:hypothetical protein